MLSFGGEKLKWYTVKNVFMICNHNIISFVKSTKIIYVVQITQYFKFLMIKSKLNFSISMNLNF